jgi:hypothetical protein
VGKAKIIHRGKYHSRTTHDGFAAQREKAFSEVWEKENTRLSGGDVAFALLCCQPSAEGWSGLEQYRELTQDIATDAATLIQWLGSNVGYSFLEEALERAGLKIVRKE